MSVRRLKVAATLTIGQLTAASEIRGANPYPEGTTLAMVRIGDQLQGALGHKHDKFATYSQHHAEVLDQHRTESRMTAPERATARSRHCC